MMRKAKEIYGMARNIRKRSRTRAMGFFGTISRIRALDFKYEPDR
jgi:hypothetical protein